MDQNLNQLEQDLLKTRVQEMKLYSDQMQNILLRLNDPRFELTALDITNIANNITHILHETKDLQHKRVLSHMIKIIDKLYTKCTMMQGALDSVEDKKTAQ